MPSERGLCLWWEKRDGWWGEVGKREAKVLKVHTFNDWMIDRLRAWFPRNGCSCSNSCFWRWLASFAFRFANKRRSTALLNEERWEEECWYTWICEMAHCFPRMCRLGNDTLYISFNIQSWSSIVMRKAPRVHCSDKTAALVTPRWCTSAIASATERRSRIFNSRFCCL